MRGALPDQVAAIAESSPRAVQTSVFPGIEVFEPTIDIPFWH
jgi:hypothetical protein